MDAAIQTFLNNNSQRYLNLRVLVTLPDGKVAYDSSKGVNNTFARYQADLINENHNTRVAIMSALLGNSGVGYEEKYSNSTGLDEVYIAERMGFSPSRPSGCVRISTNANYS
jgi:hypothetical protein